MPANKKSRRLRLAVLGVVILLVAGIGYGSYWAVGTVRASFPQTTGTLQLAGLSGPVKVMRDGKGIPQIYANTPEDLFRAQGFVQAQDRFWQMDVRRHLASGQLSEMFGSSQVQTDAFMRTLGLRQVAQYEYDHVLSATTKQYLQAYSDGVNAYLAGHSGSAISVEYAALHFENNYKPEKWTPVDSLVWLKAMAWDMSGNMQTEIDRSLMATRLTPAQIAQLYPAYPYSQNATIVSGGTVNSATQQYQTNSEGLSGGAAATATANAATANVASQLAALSSTLNRIPSLFGTSGAGTGANSWVVSGSLTATGKPLLANDPHLAAQMPSVWYQMGLHCQTVSKACPFDVSGYTLSGMPGVVIGHNQNIAWGMTNLGAAVTDLYLEKINSNETYLYDGKNVPFVTRKETIKVAGGASRVITVRTTQDGMPVISDSSSQLPKAGGSAAVGNAAAGGSSGYAVALKWTALTPSKTMDSVFEIDKATDWTTFRAGAADFAVPSQNLTYADTKGNIGYQATGQIPIRANGDNGTAPVPGWDSKYRWQSGYIPFSALPYEFNPKSGYIVAANQAVINPSKYPYVITEDWDYGTRSQQIIDLIKSKTTGGGLISTDDMQSMQMDSSSEIAKLLVPYLLKVNITSDKNNYVRNAQQLLQGWASQGYQQSSDSAAAAYFNAVWSNVLKLAFGNKMPQELRPVGQCITVPAVATSGPVDSLNGKAQLVRECGQSPAAAAQPDGGGRWIRVVRNILPDQHSQWWIDSPTAFFDSSSSVPRTDRDQLLAQAMKDARYELTAKLGKNINTWSWGRLHTLQLNDPTLATSGPGFLQTLLNRGPWFIGGGDAAIDASSWNAASGSYDAVVVPSMRMVVNLADFDNSRWINLTGASGHAYDAHYSDQTTMWAKGELLPWAFSPGRVAKATVDTLTLTP
jgi:penicillin amidase